MNDFASLMTKASQGLSGNRGRYIAPVLWSRCTIPHLPCAPFPSEDFSLYRVLDNGFFMAYFP